MLSFSPKLHCYSISTPKSTKFLHNQQLNVNKCSKQPIKAVFGSNGDDFRAIKRIVKFNSAIQNRSIKEFFELACDEYEYLCTSLPLFDFISLSKKSFSILCALMAHNNVSFVIKPKSDEGFDLGVRWNFALIDHSVPLGFGCNLSTSHLYRGNMVISKANNLVQPLISISSHPLISMSSLLEKTKDKIMQLMNKILPEEMLDEKKKEIFINILICLIIMFMNFILLKKLFV